MALRGFKQQRIMLWGLTLAVALGVSRVARGQGPDTTPPVLSKVTITPRSPESVEVRFITNEPSMHIIQYGRNLEHTEGIGPAEDYREVLSDRPVKTHTYTITGLRPDAEYRLRILAADAAKNTSTSSVVSRIARPSSASSRRAWNERHVVNENSN